MIYLSRKELLTKISDNANGIEELILYIDDNNCHLFGNLKDRLMIPYDNYLIYYNVRSNKLLWDDMIHVKDLSSLIYLKG